MCVQWVKPRGKSSLTETARQPKNLLPRLVAWEASQSTSGARHAREAHLHSLSCVPLMQLWCLQWVKPKGKSSLPETVWQPKDLLPRRKRLLSKRRQDVTSLHLTSRWRG